jgi:serine/threonine protein kinase
MSLPSNTDYIQAVQQPKVAFLRADIQGRCASRNRLNLPISWSGNFAIVFKLDGTPKPVALRCFTQPVSQIQERYRAYSNFLRGQVPANLRRSLLSLEFLDAGMRVGAQTVPVILMEWQEGDDLLEWIKSHAGQRRRLQALRDAFRALLADMERCGFVHGDLQHGNVMVSSQGHPVLVDYDNLLVPGAKAFGLSNQGLPGFQHPAVSAKTDHRLLDRMPAMVIYSALEILSVAPELAPDWDQIDGLVFQAKDLVCPRGSQLFQALEAHPHFQGFGLHLTKALVRWRLIDSSVSNNDGRHAHALFLWHLLRLWAPPWPLLRNRRFQAGRDLLGNSLPCLHRGQSPGHLPSADPRLAYSWSAQR